MTAPDSRYRIVAESQSAHCCFDFTIVDTTKPDMIGDKQYVGRNGPQFESVCECFEEADAKLICDALNLQALARGPQQAGGEDGPPFAIVSGEVFYGPQDLCLAYSEAKRDAERYRWLRKRVFVDRLGPAIPCGRSKIDADDAARTDSAIDAARLVRDGDSGEGES